MRVIRLGLCGLGTVGAAVLEMLARNGEEIARQVGCRLEVSAVGLRRKRPELDLRGARVESDLLALAEADDVDVIVELIGGTDDALKLVRRAIKAGKQVVTANKALIAEHGAEIFAAAEDRGVCVAFEAAVAGGIPLIRSVREGLVANRIQGCAGIINATSNFVLSEMRTRGCSFEDALATAQRYGYAEADATFDTNGADAAHKLTILAAIAFGQPFVFDDSYREGIEAVESVDVRCAAKLGYRIKPLVLAQVSAQGVELRVHPALIPETHLLARVDGVMNAVCVTADATGLTFYGGPGAGGEPTASSVIADLAEVARLLGSEAPQWLRPRAFLKEADPQLPIRPIAEVHFAYYLRILAGDASEVQKQVRELLAEREIGIKKMLAVPDEALTGTGGVVQVPVVLVTESVQEAKFSAVFESIVALRDLRSVVRLRIEHLEGFEFTDTHA